MAKFPINPGDDDGAIADSINYLLSGPAGLGQNFQGFSSTVEGDSPPRNLSAYLTGNFRPPFTQADPAATYVAPIALSTLEYLDSRTLKFTFAESQSTPPFALGNGPDVTGSSLPSIYDGRYRVPGVVECTTEYVIVRVTGDGTVYPAATGGTVLYSPFGGGAFVSTDANAKVLINGGTDRVFCSAQLDQVLTYTASEPSNLTISVMINRRVGSSNADPTNPDFVFAYDTTVAVKNYNITVDATRSGLVTNGLTFSGVRATVSYPDTYTVIPTTITGTGRVGQLQIQIAAGGGAYTDLNTEITVAGAGGSGYAVGDTLLIPGSRLGGSDGINDMNLTVTQVSNSTATLPPTTFANWYGPVELETIFTSVIDHPPIGYYWYLIEQEIDVESGDAVITADRFGYRTLTVQVVKQ